MTTRTPSLASLKAMNNLGDLLTASAARNPQQAAMAVQDKSISYAWLEQATTRLAQWFLQRGCKPGDRIACYWPNPKETAELYFACFKAGLIAVPVNVLMKASEVAYVLEHSVMCFARHDPAQVAMEAGQSCASLRVIPIDGSQSIKTAISRTRKLPRTPGSARRRSPRVQLRAEVERNAGQD